VKAVVALVLATLMWAGNYVVGQVAVQTMSPVSLTWLRWVLAAVPLLLLAQVLERPDWRAVARVWRRLLVLSVLGVGGYTLLLYAALQFTSALSASLINAANPAVMVLLAALILRERMGWRGIVGLLLGLVGVLVIVTNGAVASIFSLKPNPGDLLMVGAIVVWSLYTIFGKGLALPPITATAAQAVIAAVLLTPVALLTGASWPRDAPTLWALLFIAVFPSIGSYALWNTALTKVRPGQAGLYLNLITVFTVLISVILGATLTLPQVLGGLLVFAGVGVNTVVRKPATSGDIRGGTDVSERGARKPTETTGRTETGRTETGRTETDQSETRSKGNQAR
jgi:drug/metabolite transporter (DMT)-like permease